MTLVEIMIVVIIMAMIAAAVGIAVLPQLEAARIRQTRADAATMQSAAVGYFANAGECPGSIEELVEARVLDGTRRTTDAWDHEFDIVCEGGDVIVASAGPDGDWDTEDDIGSAER